ncbi:MAG TPA: class I SAM-dependent methyltransferase [Gaiellaceae bacterium]|jgi:SAM-dependent methyltransferase|nr:class I SAM-dependent methyltransferase [Gaiellaceae bacterium]
MSYPEAFAANYDRWAADMTEDVPFYVELAKEADGPIVELAVGSGRVAIPVAEASDRKVIGIDSSPAMLTQARAAGGDVLDLRLGDIRRFELDEPAALIYCPFRALLHLPTWADRRVVFDRVATALRPGGRFAWNAFAFDHTIAARLDGQRQEEPIPHVNRYAVGDCRIDIVLDSGDTSSLWWATKNEWLGLIDVSGLEVEALYGWFDGRPFDDESREFVWVARKPGGPHAPDAPLAVPGRRGQYE